MNSTFVTRMLKRTGGIFVDCLAWTGLAIGFTVFTAAGNPQFEQQLEHFSVYVAVHL